MPIEDKNIDIQQEQRTKPLPPRGKSSKSRRHLEERYGFHLVREDELILGGDEAFEKGDYDAALNKYDAAESLAIKRDDFVRASFLTAKIANTYVKLGDYDNAMYCYIDAKEAIKDSESFQKIHLPSYHHSRIKTISLISLFACVLISISFLYGEGNSLLFSPLLNMFASELLVLLFFLILSWF